MSPLLSDREQQVVQLLWEGLNTKEIGRKLGLSVKTIGMHRARIMRKLGASNIAQLIRAAIERGIIIVELTSSKSFRRRSLLSLFATRAELWDQSEEPQLSGGGFV